MNPPITVLMPVYNSEKYLKESIESILNQTFKDFEFLVINDGSTDNTEKIILNYTDPRIRYLKNEKNIRLISTLNKGFELAQGKYIVRMDADDISLPDRIAIQYQFMETHPDVAVCGSWFETIGDTNKIVKYVGGHQQIMLKMLYQCHLCHPSLIIRKSALDDFPKKFDPSYLHAEDYEFFTRMGETKYIDNIQAVLLKYRHHPNSVSINNKIIQDENSIRVKKHLFHKLGLNVSEGDLEVFRKISEHSYDKTKYFLDQSNWILQSMEEANNKSHFFETDFFQKSMSVFWFHVCYNLTSLGLSSLKTYYSSPLTKFYTPRLLYKIKFFIKSLFRL